MKRMSVVALLTLAFGAGAAPAHALTDPEPVQPFVPGINEDPALSKAWQKWQAKGIDDYVVTVRLSCFCPRAPAVRTVIRDDHTVRVTKGERRLGSSRGYSMDELFGMIRDANAEADNVDGRLLTSRHPDVHRDRSERDDRRRGDLLHGLAQPAVITERVRRRPLRCRDRRS